MARINFQVKDSQKTSFEEYIESDPEFESLSHFFRVAGIHEMQEEENGQQELELPPELVNRLNKIEDGLQEIKSEVETINAKLDSGTTDINEIANRLRQTLHTLPAPSTAELSQSDMTAEELESQFAYSIINQDYPTTLEELARELEEDKHNIELAFDELKESFIPVREFVDDEGVKHYFKEGERR